MTAPLAHLPRPDGLGAALRAEIHDAVRQALTDTGHAAPGSDPDVAASGRGRRLVDRAGAADYLAVSKSQIDVWARRGLLTRLRWGRVVRFDLDDLDQFADSWERT